MLTIILIFLSPFLLLLCWYGFGRWLERTGIESVALSTHKPRVRVERFPRIAD